MALYPSTAQLQAAFAPLFQMIEAAGESVVVRENTGPDAWTDHPPIKARPWAYSAEEIIAGSTLKQGDMRLICIADPFPVARRLEQKDRVHWRGRDYAIISDDAGAQYAIGGLVYARVLQVRG